MTECAGHLDIVIKAALYLEICQKINNDFFYCRESGEHCDGYG